MNDKNWPDPPQWIIKMHEHYQQNGYYRAEDLNRVLGDPRESVEIKVGKILK